MPPWLVRGAMVQEVTLTHTTYNELTNILDILEAGTPNIADINAFREALSFIEQVGYSNIRTHETGLLNQGLELPSCLKKVLVIGNAANRGSSIAFTPQEKASITYM